LKPWPFIEIVGIFPLKNGDFPVRYVTLMLVYQRVGGKF
jgi:hypothetical protein